MIRYVCDRCGDECKVRYIVTLGVQVAEPPTATGGLGQRPYDYCGSCRSDLRHFMERPTRDVAVA